MSAIFDSITVSGEVKRFVDHSFDIVDQIYEILERQEKTQRDLANLLGKKESEISKWMQGTHNFTIKSLAKIEDILGEEIIITPRKWQKKTNQIPVWVHTNKLRTEKLQNGNWTNVERKSLFGNKGLKVA